MSTLFEFDPATLRGPSLTKKEKARNTKAEIKEKYDRLRAGEMQGKDWVEDELLYRDERDSLAEIPRQGIILEPDDDKWFRGVLSGPGWQLRPVLDEAKPRVRIGVGRKSAAIRSAAAFGKVFTNPFAFFVVGAVISVGNGKHLRIEGAVDLHNTCIPRCDVVLKKMGLWKNAIIQRSGRNYIRAVMWVCDQHTAMGTEYNDIITTGWEGKKLLVTCATPKFSDGMPWLKITGAIAASGDEVQGYAEVGKAIFLKARRAVMQREMFFRQLRGRLENLIWAGKTCNHFTEDVLAISKVMPALGIPLLCDSIREMSPIYLDEEMTERAKASTRKRYYGAKLQDLFRLNRKVALENTTSLSEVIGFTPPNEAKPAQVELPSQDAIAQAAVLDADDIEKTK